MTDKSPKIRFLHLSSGGSYLPLLSVVAVGAALRLAGIGRQSLWLDEMTSIQVALEPLARIVTGKIFDNHTPPLYYALLHVWSEWVPLTESGLRLPSAAIDVANIAMVALLSQRFLSREGSLLTTAGYAVSPFMLYYAQEGRMYTLMVFFALAYMLSMERVVRGERYLVLWSLLSGVVMALGLYTHYYFAFHAAGVAALSLFVSRRSARRVLAVLLSGVVGVLLFSPWIPVVLSLASTGGQGFRRFTFTVLPYTLFRFVFGYAVFPLNMGTKDHFTEEVTAHIPHIAIVFIVAAFLVANGLARADRQRKRFTVALAWVALMPAVVGLLISLSRPMLSERYLVPAFPLFLMLSLGMLDLGRRQVRIAALGLFALFAAGDVLYFTSPDFGKAQWREAAAYVAERTGERDTILVEPRFAAPVFRYYFDVYGNGSIVRDLPPGRPAENGASGVESALERLVDNHRRLVLVTSGTRRAKGYERHLSRFARNTDTRVFPLETGITCTTWERTGHLLEPFGQLETVGRMRKTSP